MSSTIPVDVNNNNNDILDHNKINLNCSNKSKKK